MNIAEILKNKPKGTKLYDYLYNTEVDLDEVDKTSIRCTHHTKNDVLVHHGYSESGKFLGCEQDALQILFPSKSMRDWSKFAWTAGNFLMNKAKQSIVMFCSWANDDYTKFKGVKFSTPREGTENIYDTCDYEDFDMYNYHLESYVNPTTGATFFKVEPKEPAPSMESKESISSTQPAHEFKPFDKVVARFNDVWCADIFSHKVEACNGYGCIGGYYDKILPYNEETAKLIGTTKTLEDLK